MDIMYEDKNNWEWYSYWTFASDVNALGEHNNEKLESQLYWLDMYVLCCWVIWITQEDTNLDVTVYDQAIDTIKN